MAQIAVVGLSWVAIMQKIMQKESQPRPSSVSGFTIGMPCGMTTAENCRNGRRRN